MTDDLQPTRLSRPATLKDIAQALKVDVSTVSKVLSGGGISVRPETRQAIIDTAQRLNYTPHAYARNLRTRRTGVVTYSCIPSENSMTITEPLRGVRTNRPTMAREPRPSLVRTTCTLLMTLACP